MKSIRGAILSALILSASLSPAAPQADPVQWMEVEESALPLRKGTTRNAEIIGLVRKGQVLAVERTGENWVKVRVGDSLSGWVPAASMSPSGPPVHVNRAFLKGFIIALAALGAAGLLFLGISLRRRGAEGRMLARQALADSKRRLQNKIQMLFQSEPRIRSHLAMGEAGLRDFLQGIGYIANLEKEPERFMDSCKAFRPNLILAGFEFRDRLESMVETDAMLINTPVVFLNCGLAAAPAADQVRAFLETNASEKEIGDAIARCLRKSPERIRFSVKPVALKGEIQPGTLMELLHFLAAVKKSGRLRVVSGTEAGELALREGDMTESSLGGHSGGRAAEEILNLASGSFEFYERPAEAAPESGSTPAGAKTYNTQKILMDWAKGKDESNHHSRA